MTSTLGLDFDIVFASTHHGIGNMLGRRRQDDDGGSVCQAQVVRLGETGEIRRRNQPNRYIFPI